MNPSHQYLENVTDVMEVVLNLESDKEYNLPFLMHEIVLFPGMIVPMRAVSNREIQVFQMAMDDDRPITNMIVIINNNNFDKFYKKRRVIACTAEIKQMGQDSNNILNIVVKAKQRIYAEVSVESGELALEALTCNVRIINEIYAGRVPFEMQESFSYWSRPFTKHFDPFLLAEKAKELAMKIIPNFIASIDDPLSFSYILASKMPINHFKQQKLLEIESVYKRLLMEIDFLLNFSEFYCAGCNAYITRIDHLFSKTDEGSVNVYVNPQGSVHDLITSLRVSNTVKTSGQPSEEFSWFPGYAWTIIECRHCGIHLGWKFTATIVHLTPSSFFGLRCSQLNNSTNDNRYH